MELEVQPAANKALYKAMIVVLGSFNPSILHPEWFERFGILPKQEVEAVLEPGAMVEFEDARIPRVLVSSEASQIIFPNFELKVQLSRLEFSTSTLELFDQVPDVITKIFYLLPHTPVHASGINFNMHLPLEKDVSNLLKGFFQGKFLIEKTPAQEGILQILGDSYQTWGSLRFNRDGTVITLQIQSSLIIENGLFLGYNFHRDLKTKVTKEVQDILSKNFNNDFNLAIKIRDYIIMGGSPL